MFFSLLDFLVIMLMADNLEELEQRLADREEELRRREEAIQRREQELEKIARVAASEGGSCFQ